MIDWSALHLLRLKNRKRVIEKNLQKTIEWSNNTDYSIHLF